MKNVQLYLKAIFGALSAGLGSLATILVGSNETFTQITDAQWVTIAIVTIGALGVVWGVPNKPPDPPA